MSNAPQNINGRVVHALAGQSLGVFITLALPFMIPGFWHFPYFELIAARIDEMIDPLRRGRLVVNLPPRHGKSFLLLASIAYYLGRYPSREVMLVCHSDSLARDLSAKLHALIASGLFRSVFPRFRLQPGRESTTDFRTDQGGGFVAGGPDSRLTGRGADLLVLDDTISAQDAQSSARMETVRHAFDTMLSTRLNDPRTGSIILIAHRVAPNDLSGHLLSLGRYKHLRLPFRAEQDELYEYPGGTFTRKPGELLQEGRISEEEAKEIEARPAHIYAAQFQQNPIFVGSGLICPRHFPVVDSAPGGGHTVISWDIAASVNPGASFSVGLVFEVHQDVAYLKHIRRGQVDYATLKHWGVELQERFRPSNHVIEAASLGKALASDLRAYGANVQEWPAGSSSKVDRVGAVLDKLEGGFVQIVRGVPHLENFLNECFTFPHGGNDDQVDALSQFLAWVSTQKPPEPKVFKVLRPGYKNSRLERMNIARKSVRQPPLGRGRRWR